jgi:hypothetical protein
VSQMSQKPKADTIILEVHPYGCIATAHAAGRFQEFLGDFRNLAEAYRYHGDGCLPVRVRDLIFGGKDLYEIQTTGQGQFRLVREGADAPSPNGDLVRRMLQPIFN